MHARGEAEVWWREFLTFERRAAVRLELDKDLRLGLGGILDGAGAVEAAAPVRALLIRHL
jgi:hypothetical protein